MNNIKKTILSKEFGRDLGIYFTIVMFFTIFYAPTIFIGIIFVMYFIAYMGMTLKIDSKIPKN